MAEDSEYGIYAEIFENLRQELLDLVLQMIVNDDNAGISFEELKNKVIQKICQFQCPETLTEDVCVPICIFYIMEALDSYVEKDLEETYDACHDFEPSEYEEDNIQRVTALLDLAIQKGANIFIFPEFIMSERMRDAVQTYLRQMQYDKKKRLILVLAGTCYHWDGKSRGNNILHIFNANGMEVGRYYKYSPFLIQKEERIHGADVSSTKSVGL